MSDAISQRASAAAISAGGGRVAKGVGDGGGGEFGGVGGRATCKRTSNGRWVPMFELNALGEGKASCSTSGPLLTRSSLVCGEKPSLRFSAPTLPLPLPPAASSSAAFEIAESGTAGILGSCVSTFPVGDDVPSNRLRLRSSPARALSAFLAS